MQGRQCSPFIILGHTGCEVEYTPHHSCTHSHLGAVHLFACIWTMGGTWRSQRTLTSKNMKLLAERNLRIELKSRMCEVIMITPLPQCPCQLRLMTNFNWCAKVWGYRAKKKAASSMKLGVMNQILANTVHCKELFFISSLTNFYFLNTFTHEAVQIYCLVFLNFVQEHFLQVWHQCA